MNADDGSAVLRGGGDRASAKTTKTAKGNKGKQKALKKANKVQYKEASGGGIIDRTCRER